MAYDDEDFFGEDFDFVDTAARTPELEKPRRQPSTEFNAASGRSGAGRVRLIGRPSCSRGFHEPRGLATSCSNTSHWARMNPLSRTPPSRRVIIVHMKLAACAVLTLAWAAAAHARDLDKGTVTGDGTDYEPPGWRPVSSCRFTPQNNQLYFKISNPNAEIVVLQYVRVRLAVPEDVVATGSGDFPTGCSGSYSINEQSPLRTWVAQRPLPSSGSQLSLAIELEPCESILIEASGAVPGQEHIIAFGAEFQPEQLAPPYLEIWDGDCND